MREITDTELVEQGDQAFRTLHRKYRFTGTDAEDIKQEIYVALVRARDRYEPGKGKWAAYAFITAKGAVRDYFRKHVMNSSTQWRRQKGEDQNGSAVRFVSHDELLYERGIEDSHQHLEDEHVMESLNARERFLVLCLSAGYSLEEASRMMGISPSRAHNILNRLRLGKLRYLNLRRWETTPAR